MVRTLEMILGQCQLAEGARFTTAFFARWDRDYWGRHTCSLKAWSQSRCNALHSTKLRFFFSDAACGACVWYIYYPRQEGGGVAYRLALRRAFDDTLGVVYHLLRHISCVQYKYWDWCVDEHAETGAWRVCLTTVEQLSLVGQNRCCNNEAAILDLFD